MATWGLSLVTMVVGGGPLQVACNARKGGGNASGFAAMVLHVLWLCRVSWDVRTATPRSVL
jgi:hypothetical protein